MTTQLIENKTVLTMMDIYEKFKVSKLLKVQTNNLILEDNEELDPNMIMVIKNMTLADEEFPQQSYFTIDLEFLPEDREHNYRHAKPEFTTLRGDKEVFVNLFDHPTYTPDNTNNIFSAYIGATRPSPFDIILNNINKPYTDYKESGFEGTYIEFLENFYNQHNK